MENIHNKNLNLYWEIYTIRSFEKKLIAFYELSFSKLILKLKKMYFDLVIILKLVLLKNSVSFEADFLWLKKNTLYTDKHLVTKHKLNEL